MQRACEAARRMVRLVAESNNIQDGLAVPPLLCSGAPKSCIPGLVFPCAASHPRPYLVSARHIAYKMQSKRRASATTAMRLPRRAATRSAHVCTMVASAHVGRRTPHAASIRSRRTRVFPAFVIAPRGCLSPELAPSGTSPM